MANYSATGHVVVIGPTEVKNERFSKRTLVLEIHDGKFPQTVEFQCVNDKTQLLDDIEIGEMVSVDFNLRGREWTSPKGEIRYFNSLNVWKLDKEQAAIPADAVPVAAAPMPSDEDIPF